MDKGACKGAMDLNGKKILIVGMARSGMGAARLCCLHGGQVWIIDQKTREQLQDKIDELKDCEITYWLGIEPMDEELAAMDMVVLSPGAAPDQPLVQRAARLGAKVLGEVELAWLYSKAPMIGITGTNGKTTTTALVGELMSSWQVGSVTAGNIGKAYTEVAEKVQAPDWLILELSSFQLEMTETFRPHVSAMLNITPDHLNRHKTMDGYVGAKRKIFANQTAEDWTVLNYDDPWCRRMGEELSAEENAPQVVYFSRATKLPHGLWIEDDAIITNLRGKEEEVGRVSAMRIFGAHNEENVLAAIGCVLCAGMPAERVEGPLNRFAGVEHRIEYVATVNEVSYYNDSKATNPDSAVKGLLAMKTPTVLIGGGMDKQIPFDDWCKLFVGRVSQLILLGETRQEIYDCAIKWQYPAEQIHVVDTLEEAVAVCAKVAQPGESVLLSPACASWDMFESYEQRGRIFKEEVRAL